MSRPFQVFGAGGEELLSSLRLLEKKIQAIERIRALGSTSTSSDVAAKVNELLAALQGIVAPDYRKAFNPSTGSGLFLADGSRAVRTAASGEVEASPVTADELGYLTGVTGPIQDQIDGIVPVPPLTASRAVVTDGTGGLAVATTTAAEIAYVNGVTSAIQTQLGTKATINASAAWGTSPFIFGSTTAGLNTYSVQIGRSVVIGNLVFYIGYIILTALGTDENVMAGNVRIGTLPYAGNSGGYYPVTFPWWRYITLASGYTQIGGYVNQTATEIIVTEMGSGGAGLELPVSALSNNSTLMFAGFYFTG